MKNILNNFLTVDEQKVVIFILVFAFIGMLAQYSGLTAEEKVGVIDSLKVKKDVEIKFDLTTVTIEELQSIPGIGEKKAEDIIDYRNEFGFRSRNDLLNIKGIGEVSLNKIKNWFYEMDDEVNTSPESNESSPEINNDCLTINLNTANDVELCKLKGIGPVKAEKIIALRDELGGFKSIDDLLQIKGIGVKTLEKIKEQIILGE